MTRAMNFDNPRDKADAFDVLAGRTGFARLESSEKPFILRALPPRSPAARGHSAEIVNKKVSAPTHIIG